jgi:hypothetical protein|tara:strand:+ start:172 stop:393 length:222 start_codon:yes stop_codon:yes gene_type:complete
MVFKKKKKNKDLAEEIEKAVVKPINKPDNYKLVADSLKELEELVPEKCVDHYSCSNGFVILQNAIKQIKLAGQ